MDTYDEDTIERDDEDATLSDYGQLGAQTVATFGHQTLGIFDDELDAEVAIADEMRRSGFWPNVWRISDHGNEILISERFYREHDANITGSTQV